MKAGEFVGRREFLRSLLKFIMINDIELKRGRFRVKGDVIDVFPSGMKLRFALSCLETK